MTADIAPGEPLRVDKLLAYGWSSVRSLPSVRDQVDAALAAARKSGFDGLAKEQRAYLDDFWDRADVELDGRPGAPAGGALRDLPRPAGRRPRRAARDPGQGPDRARATTATRSGTPRASSLPLLTYTVPDAAARRAALALVDAGPRDRARRHAAPGGRRVPVAHDPRAGVLGLLAGRHGRVPHQRRHRRGGDPLRAGHRRRGVRAHRRARAAGADRPAVALAGPPRRRGRLPHRRRDRAGRVHRDRRRQRLHEPDGAVEPARGGRMVRAAPGRGARRWTSTPRRRPRGATPPTRWRSPTTTRSTCTRRTRTSRARRSGTST